MSLQDWQNLGHADATNNRPYDPPQHGPIFQAYSAGYDEGEHS